MLTTLLNSGLYTLSIIVWSAPWAIIGGISRFRPGSRSTTAQRVWVMTWLCFGQLFAANGILLPLIIAGNAKNTETMTGFVIAGVVSLLQMMILAAPAIWGFVVVGQMLRGYGSCIRLY
jgi:hypothetical protein